MDVVRTYFLAAVNSAQKAALNAKKIIYADFELEGEQGIILDETQLLNGLRALKKVVLAELPTKTDGVFKIMDADITGLDPEYAQGDDLKWYKNKYAIPAGKKRFLKEKIMESLRVEEAVEEESEPGCVIVENWNGESRNNFCRLAEEILWPKIRTKIIISVPHGRNSKPVDDDNFHIRIWSAPPESGDRKTATPSTIWGTSVSCTDPSFKPSGRGLVITDEKTGYAVAELVNENTLYIFHDLCHYSSDSELLIFRKILEAIVAPEVFSQLKSFRRPAPIKEKVKSPKFKPEEIEINKALVVELPGFSKNELALVRGVYTPIIARELATKIQRGVCLHKNRNRNKQQLPFYNEMFHIFFFNSLSTDNNEREIFTTSKLWGINLSAEIKLRPIDREEVGVYDDIGQKVGQIIGGRNLYVPSSLLSGRENVQLVFARLLSEVASLLNSTAAERQQWEEEIRRAKGQAYAAICWQHEDSIKKDAEIEFKATASQIKNLQTQLVAAIRKHDVLKEATSGKGKGAAIYWDRLAADFDRMGRLEKIQNISFTPDCLIVETDTLYYQHPEKKETYLIGAFQIVIPFTGSCHSIRFFNLTQRIKGFNAPNVLPNGRASFSGQLQETLPQLIARFDFLPLIAMCIIFLESVNVGQNIEDWPIVKK